MDEITINAINLYRKFIIYNFFILSTYKTLHTNLLFYIKNKNTCGLT